MEAKPILYRGTVVIYATQNGDTLRISTGIKADRLTASGMIPRGVAHNMEMNSTIKQVLKKVQNLIDANEDLKPSEIAKYYKTGVRPTPQPTKANGLKLDLFGVIDRFIKASISGERRTGRGKKLSEGSIENYRIITSKIHQFAEKTGYDVRNWKNINDNFYHTYCEYCWYTLDNFDGTVGRDIIFLRTVLKWMMKTELTDVKVNLANWYILKEESTDQDFIIFYEDEIKLLAEMPLVFTKKEKTERMEEIRDCVLMGIFTCLRLSDLMNLTEEDLSITPNEWHIIRENKKTKAIVRIPLFEKGIEIIKKYRGKYPTLLPKRIQVTYNNNVRTLAAHFAAYVQQQIEDGKTEGMILNNWEKFKYTRTRNGVHVSEMVDTKDMLSSHVCRKSGISFLLSKGMTDLEVKKISGHKYNSESFWKYIRIAEQVKDKKVKSAWGDVFKVA
ncbi:tyrosine-type recombinase/integrase [Rufibacter ruber]|uniref:tyrosine-type recombinase/integrase n=1 Tax=Rufibacter ruber TaxID=1783499 RepID=UPI00083644D6|nr:tyrosine-type recombinase/integrase [Rufibacter ruber]